MSFWVHGNHPIDPLDFPGSTHILSTYPTTGGAQEGSSSSYKQMYFTIVLQAHIPTEKMLPAANPFFHPKIVDQLQRGKKKIWFWTGSRCDPKKNWKIRLKKSQLLKPENMTFSMVGSKGGSSHYDEFSTVGVDHRYYHQYFQEYCRNYPIMIMWTLVSLLLLFFLIRIIYSHYITIIYCYYHYYILFLLLLLL